MNLPLQPIREYGWQETNPPLLQGDIASLFSSFRRHVEEADNREKVLELIGTLEKITAIDPLNYEALWQLGRYYCLMADAYSTGVEEKCEFYEKGRKACERALYGNPEFKKLIDKENDPFDSCRVLGDGDIEAMYYWYNSMGGQFKFCLNGLQKLMVIGKAMGCRKILDRMMQIDPEWGGGHPYFAYGLYYANLPKLLGRDLERSEEYFEKAITAGPNWMYIRYSRARYLYTLTKNKEAFRKDLEWVISQDPHKADSPYPWNVHFQRSARHMLAHMDDYF